MEKWLLLGIICLITLFQVINYLRERYAEKKTKALCKRADWYVQYYLHYYQYANFYKDGKRRMAKRFKKTYKFLVKHQNSWYVRKCKNKQVGLLLDFFETTGCITKIIPQYLRYGHYYTSTEFYALKALCENMERLSQELKLSPVICMDSYDQLRKKHNEGIINRELRDNEQYFYSALKYSLDKQQREAIVNRDDNCLVISSAGSGKTSTIIGKAKFLLEQEHVKSNEILVLSYNRKTIMEIHERLDRPDLTCETFHSLALKIIGDVEGKRPTISDEHLLMKCYYDLVARNSDYKNVVTKFFGEKYSLTKSEHEYSTGEDYYKDRRKYGIIAPYTDMEGKVIYTRSEEEKKICTWLTTHGVEFAYEKPYPIETGDEKHRNYKPDFTIFFNRDGKRYYFFLEHFGIDAEGKVPRWFGEGVRGGFDVANRKYNEGIEWKRATHKKNHTLLIETTSAMFKDGTVFNHLEEQLRKYGVPMYMLTPEERYERMFKQNRAMEENVRKLFSSFINLMKSNEKTFDGIMHEIDQSNVDNAFKERNRYLMYKLIRPLYYEYQISMDLKDEVDFTDLILRATELCKSKQWKSPYSYILVDEFQDISVDRYKFLKSLRNESPRTQLFCVGDDWQSIYRFSGSDISLFNHFEDFFGPAEKCKIETTYRFCNPLIERSSQFILQNSNQLKKNIKPFNTSATTELSFIPFKKDDNYENFKNKLAEILRTINQGESILLLGRYKQDADMVSDKSYNDEYCPEGNFIIFRCMSLEFMTIHSAKGLEADHVIILNCSQDRKGFPSRISDDPILEYLLSRSENYMDAEERRLFYVAITRARIHTYVMYNEDLPSIFVTEMLGQNDSNVMLCPCCKSGVLKPVYDGYNAYGRKYRKFLCGNSIAGCSYEWTTFYHDESEIVENYHRDLDPYLKLDKIKIDSPEALNEFGNMLRNKEEYERIK